MVKNPLANAGNSGSIPGSGRFPRKGNGNPLQDSCLGIPMVCYRPWGHKELDTTEGLKQQHALGEKILGWP